MSHQHFYDDLVVWLRQMCNLLPLLKVPDTVEVSMRAEGRHADLFPVEPSELAGAHPVLQADARFPDGQRRCRAITTCRRMACWCWMNIRAKSRKLLVFSGNMGLNLGRDYRRPDERGEGRDEEI